MFVFTFSQKINKTLQGQYLVQDVENFQLIIVRGTAYVTEKFVNFYPKNSEIKISTNVILSFRSYILCSSSINEEIAMKLQVFFSANKT